jgi:hypothetical protein
VAAGAGFSPAFSAEGAAGAGAGTASVRGRGCQLLHLSDLMGDKDGWG